MEGRRKVFRYDILQNNLINSTLKILRYSGCVGGQAA